MKPCKTCPTDISWLHPNCLYCDVCHKRRKAERSAARKAEDVRLAVALSQFRRTKKAVR